MDVVLRVRVLLRVAGKASIFIDMPLFEGGGIVAKAAARLVSVGARTSLEVVYFDLVWLIVIGKSCWWLWILWDALQQARSVQGTSRNLIITRVYYSGLFRV